MKKSRIHLLIFYCFAAVQITIAQNDKATIANLIIDNDAAAKTVTLTFDIQDPEDLNVEVLLKASYDEGQKFLVNTTNATGDVGFPVAIARKVGREVTGD